MVLTAFWWSSTSLSTIACYFRTSSSVFYSFLSKIDKKNRNTSNYPILNVWKYSVQKSCRKSSYVAAQQEHTRIQHRQNKTVVRILWSNYSNSHGISLHTSGKLKNPTTQIKEPNYTDHWKSEEHLPGPISFKRNRTNITWEAVSEIPVHEREHSLQIKIRKLFYSTLKWIRAIYFFRSKEWPPISTQGVPESTQKQQIHHHALVGGGCIWCIFSNCTFNQCNIITAFHCLAYDRQDNTVHCSIFCQMPLSKWSHYGNFTAPTRLQTNCVIKSQQVWCYWPNVGLRTLSQPSVYQINL
jgi:hypothetical protein